MRRRPRHDRGRRHRRGEEGGGGGWKTVADTFLTGIGWYNETAPNGYESEYTGNRSKGRLVEPDGRWDWVGGDTLFPFQQNYREDDESVVFYQALDKHDRAQGARACLNSGDFSWESGEDKVVKGNPDSMINGTQVPRPMRNFPETVTPGFKPGQDMNRGHLLGNQLGGSGTEMRNLVSLYARPNQKVMAAYENQVAGMVAKGQTVYYEVTANYTGKNAVPDSLTIKWVNLGTGEMPRDPITIWNTPTELKP
ncbi:DNA/RNA non-specific endonuclease [Streptomyces sp. NPDC093795]|uniref:DNA/RNA non-specific endonuclease n=1 Tax=Streptomyces sp. NPDC093795 TaxID=3366051 RepID=UPI003805A295